MIKRILKIWFTIAMYELGKCIGRELYYKLTAYDEVEVPKDFYHKNDQIDIENYIRKDDKF
ncbi:transcriptional activator RinB [Staphylococcus capitis]|uniref:transcriptional activator RinB n=1 Tax=Staphylococcus capitis TaxID=29388 RepID=UPI00321A3693